MADVMTVRQLTTILEMVKMTLDGFTKTCRRQKKRYKDCLPT